MPWLPGDLFKLILHFFRNNYGAVWTSWSKRVVNRKIILFPNSSFLFPFGTSSKNLKEKNDLDAFFKTKIKKVSCYLAHYHKSYQTKLVSQVATIQLMGQLQIARYLEISKSIISTYFKAINLPFSLVSADVFSSEGM